MSDAALPLAELNDLLDRLMADSLDEPGHDRIDALIVGDLGLRRRYIERMFLMADLRQRVRGPVPVQAFGDPMPRPRAPVPAYVIRLNRLVPAFIRRHPLAWSVACCAAFFTAYVTVITWGMLDKDGRGARLEARGARDEARGATDTPASDLAPRALSLAPPASAVATVTGERDAEWSAPAHKSEIRNQKSEIAKGEPLDLAAGIVQLKLKQGVTLRIEGPARWSIDGANNATLARGKLVAHVPKQAIGFTLVTPTAQIIDLGTEFGVTVSEQGASGVTVFQGLVRAVRRHPSAKDDDRTAQLLRAGSSIHVTDRGFGPIHATSTDENNFVRSLASVQDEPAITGLIAADDFAYPEASLNHVSGGAGYWQGPWEGDGYVGVAEQAHFPGASGIDSAYILRLFEKTAARQTVFVSARFRSRGSAQRYANWVRLFDRVGHQDPSDAFTFGLSNHQFSLSLGLEANGYQVDFGRATPGQFYHLVAKCEFDVDGPKDRLTVWVDPTGVEQSALSESLERELPFDAVAFVALRSFLTADNDVDDLRIGTTWAAVAPPSSSVHNEPGREKAGP